MNLEGALQKELSTLREHLDVANLERERLRCALHIAELEALEQRQALSASKEHVQRVQDDLSIRLDEIQELRSALVQARNELETHSKMINGSEQAAHTRMMIVELREREEFNQIISELRARIAELDAEANELSAQLNQLARSTSWKLSGPLRIVGRRSPVFARFGRRFVTQLSQLFYATMGRPEPTISRTPLQDHRHVRAACPNAPIEAEPARVTALTTFLKLRRRPEHRIGLVAAEFPPMFDKDSAGLRLYNLVGVLCEMDWRVVFVSRYTCDQFIAIAGSINDRRRYEDYLRKVGIDHVVYGVEAKELLRTVAGDLRWAYLSSPTVGDELMPMLRLHAPWADIMYDMTDFQPLKKHCKAGLKQDPASLAYAEQMQLIELTNAKIADWTVVTSEQQRRELLEIDQGLVIEVIPNIFHSPSNIQLDVNERSSLLFLGDSWNASSIDSVLWFANEIWPLIHGKGPDIVFRIIGSAPPPPIRALRARPGIEVSENVADLIDLFRYSRISVIPLRYSTGFQDRVGESLAHGVPVVATSLAAAQMPIIHEKHLLIADTPFDFANQVLRLAVDDDLWRRLQSNGLSFMQRRADVARESLGALMNG